VSGDAYLRAEVAADVQRRLTEVQGVGYDADRMVCAVVSGAGALVDLMFHPAAQALGPAKLGEAIVAAAWNAQTDARQRGYTMLALALGDEAAAAVEAVDSPAPARAAGWDTVARFTSPEPIIPPEPIFSTEPVASPEPIVREDDELSSFDPSIFRSDR
jgi:YbaB/EbfC DNA-binding family protein